MNKMNNTQKLQHLKKITKKGTSMEDLVKIIEDQEKEIINEKKERFFLSKINDILSICFISFVGIVGGKVYNMEFLVLIGMIFVIILIIEIILIIKNYYKNV